MSRYGMSELNQSREIRLKDGTRLVYRFNRGDLQSLREVWMDEVYRLPFNLQPRIVVDLGANIGMSSVWFHRKFQCERIVAVEPDEGNAQITAKNFARNSIPGEILQAAVGPADGSIQFQHSTDSNMGHVKLEQDCVTDSSNISKVRMVSMATVLGHLQDARRIDVLKVDIEGGEGALFDGDLRWLERVDSIIIELHADVTDTERVTQNIVSSGFRYLPAGSVFPNSMSAYVRNGLIR